MHSKLALLAVLGATTFSLTAHAAQLPYDCIQQVKYMISVGEGLEPGDDQTAITEMGNHVEVDHAKLIKQEPNAGGTTNDTYSAKVAGSTLSGTVTVKSTRGGCFVESLNVKAI